MPAPVEGLIVSMQQKAAGTANARTVKKAALYLKWYSCTTHAPQKLAMLTGLCERAVERDEWQPLRDHMKGWL